MSGRYDDAVGLQVMRYALESISDEMHQTVVRTARSTNIKDRQDTSSALFAIDGKVIAQTEYATPLHLGTNANLVPYLVQTFDWTTLHEGDAIVTNSPYPVGPGHLNDIACIAPVYRAGRMIAIAANQAHHVDVGGYAPGSMPFGVSEIYQEGLQIPPVRMFKSWKLDPELWALTSTNVRAPDEVRGDLEAQFTATSTAAKRLNELIDREGIEDIDAIFRSLCDYGERCARAAILNIPDGRYAFADVIEGDGLTPDLIKVAVDIEIRGDEMTFDFSRSSDEVRGPLNCRLASVSSCVYYVLKLIGGADMPANSGAYRPLTIVLREGSMLSPRYPRAVCNANITTTQRLVDVMLGALVEALPERLGAASSGSMSLVNIGTRRRDGEGFTNLIETYGGGQGAFPDADGMDGVQTHMTNTRNAPVEILERTYPLFVHGYGLRDGSGGAGRFRGGRGVWRHYQLEADAFVTLSSDRSAVPPWGVAGGGPGATSRYRTRKGDAPWTVLPSKATFALESGSELMIETPGGGGFGTETGNIPGPSTLRAVTADYDYIVVGLGGLGSAAAYWLARTGRRVLGLEQFELGHERGASQDHTRVVRLSYHRADYIELARSGYEAWAEVERESGEHLVTKTGGLHIAPAAGQDPILDDHLTSLEACGVPFEMLDSAEVMRRWPQWALKEDVQAIFQADSGIIAAARANATHRRLAQAHGAHLLERTPVTSIRSIGGEVEVICGATAHRASRVILTTDAWTNQLLAPLGLSLPLVITQEQGVYFQPGHPSAYLPEGFPIWIWADLPRFYGLPSLGGSGPKIGEDVGGREVTVETRTFEVDQAALGRVLDFARTHFASPLRQIASVKPCIYTMPPDRDFIIDALPDNPHVLIALGAAHAFKFASQIGRVLTDLATEGETRSNIARFRFGRDVLKMKDAPRDYRI